MASFGAPLEDLKTNYVLFIRSILEQSATVWHSSLSEENIKDLERVQKSAIRIILKEKYKGYKQSLAMIGLEDLETRRKNLCLDFARKCVKNKKLSHMFPYRKLLAGFRPVESGESRNGVCSLGSAGKATSPTSQLNSRKIYTLTV